MMLFCCGPLSRQIPCTFAGVVGSKPCEQHVLLTSYRWCTSLNSSDLSARLLVLMDSFAEARELIEEAKESIGSVYASEDMQDAKEQTDKTLALWEELQKKLEEMGDMSTLERLRKEHSLKMAQLRAELEEVEHALNE
ncbi:uncharacterized protein TM35_000023600 [Trypanosoma theileri]|uniref:Uncharacterized protein n=1 Tax=Trypanosoma theileri TaxID=67003 RepID=A0A1X0P7Y0_9TRYP|nr:uncharacterized protein TM35_000023600 [Trypanosoma theileri]ORC93034.1 hypothetical protein TM35_000023600 [Trypanosoma theileri]